MYVENKEEALMIEALNATLQKMRSAYEKRLSKTKTPKDLCVVVVSRWSNGEPNHKVMTKLVGKLKKDANAFAQQLGESFEEHIRENCESDEFPAAVVVVPEVGDPQVRLLSVKRDFCVN